MTTAAPLDVFRALADEVRLRILHLLMTAELSVAELVSVLGLPQSTVSRHLKPLRDAGLVETRRDGTHVYYRRGPELSDTDLAAVMKARRGRLPAARADEAALRRALDRRRRSSRDFFERMAGRYGALTLPGGGWEALAAGLAAGFAGRVVADLGAGEGALTLLLARFARRVIAVDQAPAMLRQVRAAAAARGIAGRVETAEGDLEHLPLPGGAADAAFLSQALHHAPQPARAVAEAARILRPGGVLVILDLCRHDQEWVRERLADLWMGFDPSELRGWIAAAGLRPLAGEALEGEAELKVALAAGIKAKA